MMPQQEACSMQDMFCFAVLANANTGTMYMDLTGSFPVWSFKNMQYIFVAYVYDLNAIIVCAMPNMYQHCNDNGIQGSHHGTTNPWLLPGIKRHG